MSRTPAKWWRRQREYDDKGRRLYRRKWDANGVLTTTTSPESPAALLTCDGQRFTGKIEAGRVVGERPNRHPCGRAVRVGRAKIE